MNGYRQAASAGAAIVALVFGAIGSPSTAAAGTGELIITADATLTEDHYGSIVIEADDVTLDCAGHQVIAGTGEVVGEVVVAYGRTGVVIMNCHVVGGGTAFKLAAGSSGSTLRDNVATGYEFGGFELTDGASNNTLIGNTASGGDNGFGLTDGANDNTLTGNTASGGNHGFWVVGGDGSGPGGAGVSGNLLIDNSASGAATNFQLGNGPGTDTTGNTLRGNVSRNALDNGFDLVGAENNTLVGNTATGNGLYGFVADAASNNRFEKNQAINNGHGFAVLEGGSNNVFWRNVSNHNHEYGFILSTGSTGNVVEKSAAHANGAFDAADYNEFGANTWTGNHFGTTEPVDLG